VKTLLVKFKGVISLEKKEAIKRDLLLSLDKGVVILDETADYKIIDFERGFIDGQE
jgi:hypothetical protein